MNRLLSVLASRRLLTRNAQAGATYEAVASDAGAVIDGTHASGIAVTIRKYATAPIPVGSTLYAMASGGPNVQAAFVAGADVTFEYNATLLSRDRYSVIRAWHRSTDVWVIGGDVQPL